jgi:hypothetical protein
VSRKAAIVLVFVGAALLAGCSGLKMVGTPNSERVALDAEDVVQVLSAVGFSDEEIREQGREFRNELARSGAVNLRRGDTTVAMFAVRGGLVHVTSLTMGSYVYDPVKKELH